MVQICAVFPSTWENVKFIIKSLNTVRKNQNFYCSKNDKFGLVTTNMAAAHVNETR